MFGTQSRFSLAGMPPARLHRCTACEGLSCVSKSSVVASFVRLYLVAGLVFSNGGYGIDEKLLPASISYGSQPRFSSDCPLSNKLMGLGPDLARFEGGLSFGKHHG